jgi:hypothetical protein
MMPSNELTSVSGSVVCVAMVVVIIFLNIYILFCNLLFTPLLHIHLYLCFNRISSGLCLKRHDLCLPIGKVSSNQAWLQGRSLGEESIS